MRFLKQLPFRASLAAALTYCVFSVNCTDPPAAPSVVLTSDSVRLLVDLAPFRFRVQRLDGTLVLSSAADKDEIYRSANTSYERPHYGTRIIQGWDKYDGETTHYSGGTTARILSQSAKSIEVELAGDGGVVRCAFELDGRQLVVQTHASGTAQENGPHAWNKVSLGFELPKDEHFFGMGERFASVDHRGLSLYSWAEEGGLGAGETAKVGPANPAPNGPSMTYFPIPFWLSTKGYGAWLDTTYRTKVHFGSEREDAYRAEVLAPDLRMVIYVNDDPLESVNAFTRDTGRPFIQAPWVFGPMKRVNYGGLIDGVPEWKALRDRKIPITIISDAVHFLPQRSEVGKEETLKAWATTLHENGYKLNGYYNPYVSLSIDGSVNDRAYGVEHDLFLHDKDGTPGTVFFDSGGFQDVATIDLTHAEGVAWFQQILRRALDLGYDGWMHDFGEYVQPTWTSRDGRNGTELHNAFPVLSVKAAHDMLLKERPNDFMFYARSGYTGSAQYIPAVWGGDPEATFDETQGLPAMLRGGLNLGMSGVPVWGSDISGYKCLTDAPNDKEIYLRWVEMGAVSPMMEEEDACSTVLAPKTKWSLFKDAETTSTYADMARLHTRLQPYFLQLAQAAHATGIPMMRHPFLLFPRQAQALTVEDSYFLGEALYAAPVVRRALVSRNVWFPPGRYIDLADSAVYEGPADHQVAAPLTKLPLFLREGYILPLLDATVETLAPATNPEVISSFRVRDKLDVMVALAAGSTASLLLADGTRLTATRTRAEDPNVLDVPEADLVTCSNCAMSADAGATTRIQLRTATLAQSELHYADLVLRIEGPVARRVSWDVRIIK